MFRRIGDGIHVSEAPLRFFGIEMGARMTLLETDQGIVVHSPLSTGLDEASAIGTPRWVLAPNTFHHLYAGAWLDAGLEGWAAAGLQQKRKDLSFHGEVRQGDQPFGTDIEVIPLTCFPLLNEVVLHHRASRTLVVTDLVFHIQKTAPWLTRAAMWCACGYPGCRTTLLEQVLMKRAIARREISGLLELDFDRLVMSHGAIVETEGKAALRNAFHWLL